MTVWSTVGPLPSLPATSTVGVVVTVVVALVTHLSLATVNAVVKVALDDGRIKLEILVTHEMLAMAP